ncbi:exopolysaccharide biosynthesis protein [Aurantiacibacter rhizosphaerae]|uniref:Exopolysaccharide biosynthesis protein n=1 Tax=Aurantiacibacter rhizosphaerae TaxID=2691582 RepID=A0A844XGI3_9SPHN|nr:exopolysaccharide biosynthesis protein [Aurantiacibacter rhizosphaerae]MWV28688.1 exopolysaccharide biosynthesis protein [Aurantiacibacter rhizosphaerae]
MATTPHSVGDILDCLDELAQENDAVSVGQVSRAFGSRTFGPAIMVPALLELTPVGAIPGVPTFLAVVIALVAVQKMAGRQSLWIPGILADRRVSAKKLDKATNKLRGLGRFMDRHFHRRLKVMTRAPFAQIAAGIVVLLCATVPFLEVLPFASSVPMLTIAGIGLAVLARDGVLMLVAISVSAAAMGALGYDYWDGGLSDTEAVDGLVDQRDIDNAKAEAESAGREAKSAAEDTERAVEQIGEDTERAVEETAKKAGDAVKKAGDEAASAADEATSGSSGE